MGLETHYIAHNVECSRSVEKKKKTKRIYNEDKSRACAGIDSSDTERENSSRIRRHADSHICRRISKFMQHNCCIYVTKLMYLSFNNLKN